MSVIVTLRRLVVTAALLVLACVLLAAPASAVKNLRKSFWGPAQIDGQSAFPIYQQLGVKTFSYGVDWSEVAPTRPANPTDPSDPAYKWPDGLDQIVSEAQSSGMDVLIMGLYTPPWANGGKDKSWAPTDPKDAAAFFTAMTRRYPSVHRWMVWGEPNDFVHWNPTPVGAWSINAARSLRQAACRMCRALPGWRGPLRESSRAGR